MVGIEQGKQACAGFVALMVLVEKNEHKVRRLEIHHMSGMEKYGYLELARNKVFLGEWSQYVSLL